MYFTSFEGIPFPLLVDYTDCGPARWEYAPEAGGMAWKGEFASLSIEGTYTLFMKNVENDLVQCEFALGTDDLGVFRQVTTWNRDTPSQNNMSTAVGVDFQMGTIAQIDFPWLFSALWKFRALTYSEIYDLGQDGADTAPLTWDDGN